MKYSAFFYTVTVSIIIASPLSAVEIIKCPEKAPDGFIVLKSNQNECVQLKIAVAKQSRTISDTIRDFDGDTSLIIPMNSMDNSQLRDIATIMDQTFGQTDKVMRTKLVSMTRGKPYKLILIIKDANFLAVERILNAGLDLFSKKIFDEDLPKLGEIDSRLYASYKENGLENLPVELVRALLQRNWYLFPPTLIATLKHKSEVEAIAFSHDGKYILTGSEDTAKLWDANVRGTVEKVLATLRHKEKVLAVAFSPNDNHVLTASEDRTAKLWDANARGDAKPLAIFKHDSDVLAVAFSPDGNTFVTGSWDGKARLWDANVRGNNNQPLVTFDHGGDGLLVSFGTDGKSISTIGSDSKKLTVKRWNVAVRGNDAEPVETSERNLRSVEQTLAFSPDTKSFLTSGGARKATRLGAGIVSGKDAQLLAILRDRDIVLAGAYSPDGKYILTGFADGTAKLWDVSMRGDEVHPLNTWKHGAKIYAVAFNTDGKYILTGGSDKNAKLWDLRSAADQLSLPAAQIVLYARKNNLSADKLPKHLLNELDDIAKTYLPKN